MRYKAECMECCWSFQSGYEPRAEVKADEHTQKTGHRTKVELDMTAEDLRDACDGG